MIIVLMTMRKTLFLKKRECSHPTTNRPLVCCFELLCFFCFLFYFDHQQPQPREVRWKVHLLRSQATKTIKVRRHHHHHHHMRILHNRATTHTLRQFFAHHSHTHLIVHSHTSSNAIQHRLILTPIPSPPLCCVHIPSLPSTQTISAPACVRWRHIHQGIQDVH